YGSTGCYNNSCGDFVQVAPYVVPGAAFTVTSQTGGTQFAIKFRWQLSGGNWWLVSDSTSVGYYPGTLFDSAGGRDEARLVVWLREIGKRGTAGHTATHMGSGEFPGGRFGHAAFAHTLRTLAPPNGTWSPASSAAEFVTDRNCYDVDLLFSVGSWANFYYFGGEGYGPNCQ